MVVRTGCDCSHRTDTTIFLKEVATPGNFWFPYKYFSSWPAAGCWTTHLLPHFLIGFLRNILPLCDISSSSFIFLDCPQCSFRDNINFHVKKILFANISFSVRPSLDTLFIIAPSPLPIFLIPLSWYICSIAFIAILVHYICYLLIYFSILKKKLHDGRDFIFFAHSCIFPMSRTMSCSSGHATSIWGMLMQMTNESPLFPFVYAQSVQVSPSLTGITPWKLVWAIQSNGDGHILHRLSFCTIVSFSKLCFLCYCGSFGLSGASHLLRYLLVLAEHNVLVQPFELFWLPLHGLSQRCCSLNHW